MSQLTPDEARSCSDDCEAAANAVDAYLIAHCNTLSHDDQCLLEEASAQLRDACQKLAGIAVTLTLDGVADAAGRLKKATGGVAHATSVLGDVRRTFQVAGQMMSLAEATVSGNPASVLQALSALGA